MPALSARRPRELAYAEITSNPANVVAADADVTGLTVTFTVRDRPVKVRAFIPFGQQNTAAGVPLFKLTDAANVVKSQAGTSVPSGSYAGPFLVEKRFSTPGTYTIKLRGAVSSGSFTINAAATYPAFIEALEQ